MKATVIIQNGRTSIELKPETSFEKNLIETLYTDRVYRNGKEYEFTWIADAETEYYSRGDYKNHSITLNITETK